VRTTNYRHNSGQEANEITFQGLTIVVNAMNRLLMGLVLVAGVALSGCGEQKSETPDKEGLSLQLPGVDVELEKGKGLEVKTPGTGVTVNQEGVNVTAPNVEFEAKAKKGE
jgi:hypothetical protein